MGVALTLLYVSLSLLSPADTIPALARYRILLILILITSLASIPAFLISRVSSLAAKQFWLMVLFVGWVLFTWIPHRWFGGALMTLQEFMPAAVVYFLALIHLRSPGKLEALRLVLALGTIYMLVMGLWQYGQASATQTNMPYVMVHVFGEGQEIRLRGLGTLGDPNSFAQYLLLQLPLLFVSRTKEGFRARYLVVIPVAVLFLVGVYLTGSRGAVLGLLLLIGLYLRKRFKQFGVIVSGGMALMVLVAINLSGTGRTISFSAGADRLSIWSDGLGLVKESPIWGIGYRGFSDQVGMTAHNAFLLCIAETGIIGCFLWMAVLVVTFWQLNKVIGLKIPDAKPQPSDLALLRWADATRTALIVYLFTSWFLSATYELPLYLLLGMAGAIYSAAAARWGPGSSAIPGGWPALSLGICLGLLLALYCHPCGWHWMGG